jgi:hypothetical protein
MSINQVIEFKRSSTFGAVVTYTPETAWPTDLTGVTITSNIRDSRNSLFDFTVVLTSPTTFNVTMDASVTEKWAVGTAFWDIRFDWGTISLSKTALLNIVNNVTIPPSAS